MQESTLIIIFLKESS